MGKKTTKKRTRIVDSFNGRDGVTFQQRLICCGKKACKKCQKGPAHGPYWYAFWKCDGVTRSCYIGRQLTGVKARQRLGAYGKQDSQPYT